MPYAAGNGSSFNQSHLCNLHFRFDCGMFFLLLLGLGVHVDHWHEPCREMYYVIEEPFQMVAGDYCGDLLTFTWSVQSFTASSNLILVVRV